MPLNIVQRSIFSWESTIQRLSTGPIPLILLFADVFEYEPGFTFDHAKYGQDIIQQFESGAALYKKKVADAENQAQIQTPELLVGDQIKVTIKGAELHLEPDKNSPVIMVLPLGAIFKIDDKIGDWIKIKLPPDAKGIIVVGFVHISFVQKD